MASVGLPELSRAVAALLNPGSGTGAAGQRPRERELDRQREREVRAVMPRAEVDRIVTTVRRRLAHDTAIERERRGMR
ncbi:MAG TPA: hypothetical protein VKU39_15755 [Streptosporangiaceae bacterium]|nr:hypothetical protein [Streptosporangiaceae bacterium]